MVRIENSHPIHGRQRRRVRHRRCLGAVVQFREETTPKTYVSALLRPPTPTTRTAAAATSRPCSRRRGRRLPESSYSPPPTDPGSRVGSNTSRPGRSRPPRTAAPPPPSRRRRSSTATHQVKQAEETLKKNPSASSSASGSGEVYKGIHGYTDYKAGFRREHTVSSEKAGGSHGPLRASAHIRVSARFDYQPDICKDYKETGYCGYGDSCKFMHGRGDYKSGWQLEKEYVEAEKARKRRIAMGGGDGSDDEAAEDDDDDDDEEAVPFACYICRQPFVDPVVTKCKHYFCEHCALKHHSKNKKCFVCNKPTLGIFNAAQEIRRKMAQDKQQQDG